MKTWHPLALAAFVVAAPAALVAEPADDQCGLVSADPACPDAVKPSLSLSFLPPQDSDPPISIRPQVAPIRRLPGAPAVPGYCAMPIVEPDSEVAWAARVVRPRSDVEYTMRIVKVPPCPPQPRRSR